MYIGGGIALLVVGGIMAFGVRDNVGDVDVSIIGWVLMGGGALAIILSFVLQQQRNNTSHTQVVERRDVGVPPTPGVTGTTQQEYVERRSVNTPPSNLPPNGY